MTKNKTIGILGVGLLFSMSHILTYAGEIDYQNVQAEGGKNLRYRNLDNGYLLVLVPGQEIIQSLTAFQKAKGIKFATVTGLGDVEKVQLAHFNVDPKIRKMELAPLIKDGNELSSLICSLSTLVDGKTGEKTPLPHCHVTIGLSSAKGNLVMGGHLMSATVSVVGELFITTVSQEVTKTHDGPFNGNLFDLNALDVVPIGH